MYCSEFVRDESRHDSSLISTSRILHTNNDNNDVNNNNDIKQSSGIYTTSEQRKARTKTTLIKFLLSRNIRSLRNIIHSNERYEPITAYHRQNYTRTKYINSLGHHKPSPQNDGYDGRQSPQRLSSIHINRQKFRENLPNSQKFKGPTQSGRSQSSQR